MSRLLLSIALFALLGSAMAKMGMGMWESTSEQENVAEYLKAVHGDDKVAQYYQQNNKILAGWVYDDMADYIHHYMKFLPSNVTSLFSYRPGKSGKVAFGKDIIEYTFDSESQDETDVVHGKFKMIGSDKTWTKDWEFQENGNLRVVAKIGDVTSKITFRPTLSARAQGLWEATTEGKNLDKLDEVFKFKKSPPTSEKYRVCIKREGDHYVKSMNASTGNHKYDFKINKPSEVTFGGKTMTSTTSYDTALDWMKTIVKVDGEEIKIKYSFDDRGAYGMYKKGDTVVRRFYRRLIPEDLLGNFKFAGKEINADAFRKALIGEEHTKKNIAGAQKIQIKAQDEKYLLNVQYDAGKHMDLDFKLGELGHGLTPNGTKIDHQFAFNTKMHREILEGHFFTTDKPNHYFHINFEWENNDDLVLTYHMDQVVAKRWFKRE